MKAYGRIVTLQPKEAYIVYVLSTSMGNKLDFKISLPLAYLDLTVLHKRGQSPRFDSTYNYCSYNNEELLHNDTV